MISLLLPVLRISPAVNLLPTRPTDFRGVKMSNSFTKYGYVRNTVSLYIFNDTDVFRYFYVKIWEFLFHGINVEYLDTQGTQRNDKNSMGTTYSISFSLPHLCL